MRRIIFSGVGVLLVVLLATSCLSYGRFTFNDVGGDQNGGPPEVDLRTVIIKATDKASITVEVEESVPFDEWGPVIAGISITIMDGGRTLDLYADRDGAALYDGSSSVCAVTRAHNASLDRYTFSFERSCLNERRLLIVKKVRSYHIPGSLADKADAGGGRVQPVGFTG
jgi:hypothetical protein